MSKVGSWSTTPGNNNSTPPDGWPEGQAPSTVNDCAREMMAQIKTVVNNLEYIDLNNTPSFLTATTFSMATADVTNFEVGRRVKLFDANTLYGTIISVSAAQVQVRLDYHSAQSALTGQLTSVAMGVVKASNNSLPDNIWKRRNVIINGNMTIWQRSASFQPANNAVTYTADRWAINMSTGGALAISRSERSANASNVPTLAQSGFFFTNSLLISVSAVDAAVAAGEYVFLETKVEGYDWQQIAHKPLNLSFWVNTRESGVYAVALRNTAADRSFVQNYTISAIATWTRVSIPIPEAVTTGTWDYSTGAGIRVAFVLEAGSTYQGGAGNWTAANLLATASQANFLRSAGNTFAITGIRLEEGQFATPPEIRPYQQELALSQRYFQRFDGVASGFCGAASAADVTLPLAVPLRATPTITVAAQGNIDDGFAVMSVSSGALASGSNIAPRIALSIKASTTAGRGTLFTGGSIDLDAEL